MSGDIHWPKLGDIKLGDQLVADGGFTCVSEGEVVIVECDEDGDLYFRCPGPDEGDNCDADHGHPSTHRREEKHSLSGQENEDGELVGLQRAHNHQSRAAQ